MDWQLSFVSQPDCRWPNVVSNGHSSGRISSLLRSTIALACVFRANSDSDSNSIRTLIPIHFGQRFRSKSDSDSDLNSDTFSGVPESCSRRIKLFTRSTGATLDKSAPSDLFQNEKVTNGTTQQIHASDQRNTST